MSKKCELDCEPIKAKFKTKLINQFCVPSGLIDKNGEKRPDLNSPKYIGNTRFSTSKPSLETMT